MLTKVIKESLSTVGVFHLALTGGEIGGEIARILATTINQNPEDFKGLHVWWSDERFVPHESQERNASQFLQELSPDAEIHIHQPFSADANVDVDTSARRYRADIFGVKMDLTLLSIGTDGHVASLFPDMWRDDEMRDVVAITDAPKDPPQRVSFSMHKINESARVWILASGATKSEIVNRLLAGDSSLPASHVQGSQETLLLTDFSS
jgi:6-phosphogluconolactonase